MQIASSARPTCLRLRSAVECTATVLMPRLWHARSTRSAISPRLAMTTFSSMGSSEGAGNAESGTRDGKGAMPQPLPCPVSGSPFSAESRNHEHRLVEFDRLAVLDEDRLHRAGDVGLDLVEHLHRLDDAQRFAGLDLLSDLDEGRRAGRGRG